MAWYCHECAVSFEADFSVDAREVRCVRCQGAFVEFMPQAIPPSLSSRRSDDDLDDEGYREEEEEEYYYEDDDDNEAMEQAMEQAGLHELLFNYQFFANPFSSSARTESPSTQSSVMSSGNPTPTPAGASDEAMDALPSVHLTAEHVASEPEVRAHHTSVPPATLCLPSCSSLCSRKVAPSVSPFSSSLSLSGTHDRHKHAHSLTGVRCCLADAPSRSAPFATRTLRRASWSSSSAASTIITATASSTGSHARVHAQSAAGSCPRSRPHPRRPPRSRRCRRAAALRRCRPFSRRWRRALPPSTVSLAEEGAHMAPTQAPRITRAAAGVSEANTRPRALRMCRGSSPGVMRCGPSERMRAPRRAWAHHSHPTASAVAAAAVARTLGGAAAHATGRSTHRTERAIGHATTRAIAIPTSTTGAAIASRAAAAANAAPPRARTPRSLGAAVRPLDAGARRRRRRGAPRPMRWAPPRRDRLQPSRRRRHDARSLSRPRSYRPAATQQAASAPLTRAAAAPRRRRRHPRPA